MWSKCELINFVCVKDLLLYTTRIHMPTRQFKYTSGTLVPDTNAFINFWLRFFDTKRERHNSYYADHTIWPHKRAAHPVMFTISVGRDPKNSTVCLNGRNPNFSTSWSDLNCIFFKIFQILSPSLLGMTSSTLQPHFLSVVYYDNGDCHILNARA